MRVAAIALLCVAAVAGVAAGPDAVVRMQPGTAPVSGLVNITKIADGSYDFSFDVAGLPASTMHGVHVHDFGDLSTPDGSAAGAHFNPYHAPHGCPGTDPRHVGDLGTFTTDSNGAFKGVINSEVRASGQALDLTFNAAADPIVNGNAIGRGLVIHSAYDQCNGTNGNAGTRMGQGVIGIASGASTIGSEYGGAEALYAKMYNTAGAAFGDVWIRNTSSGVGIEVFARITGLVPGSVHGFHIHQWGDHTLLSAALAGSHFNPSAGKHALPYEATDAHMGDLGNVIADDNGVVIHHAFYDTPQHIVNFQGNVQNIIGRAVVLHAWPDQGRNATAADGVSADQTGGAGSRLGMGVLGITGTNRFPSPDNFGLTRGNSIVGYAKLFGTSKRSGATGTVKITHGDDNLAMIEVSLSGMAPNVQYAIHVHDFGDMTAADGTSAGGHYNPYGFAHNCFPARGKRHTGDIGNLPNTTVNGDVTVTLFRDWIALNGENSTIGRSLIVHGANDDCQTQPTGNAGSRWLQGVLGNVAPPAGNFNGSAFNPGPKTPLVGLMAKITPTTDAAVANMGAPTGTVYVYADPADPTTTVVYVNIAGVTASTTHGFHVHTYGDWSVADGTGAGGHWNPQGYTHALPTQANNRHAGDLGNVNADANGNIVQTIRVINLPIQAIAGRAVVLHELVDQGSAAAATNGAAGKRIALGVLGILNTATVIPTQPTANTTDSSSSTGGCPADQICAGSMATPSVAALIAGALLLAVVRRD